MWASIDCGSKWSKTFYKHVFQKGTKYAADVSPRQLIQWDSHIHDMILQNVTSTPNLLFQIPNLYSINKVNSVYCELFLNILLRYNQAKKNERCLLNLQIISSDIDIVPPICIQLKRKCIVLSVISCYSSETDRCFPNLQTVIHIPDKNVYLL